MSACRGPNLVTVPEPGIQYDRTDELRGLQVILGWQLDVLACYLPRHLAWVWLCISLIWLSVILWAGPTGDWSTAMSFGQVIAASASLVFLYARD